MSGTIIAIMLGGAVALTVILAIIYRRRVVHSTTHYNNIIKWFRETYDIIFVSICKYDDIIEWSRERKDLKEADKDNIAFTLVERNPESGNNYKVVQGIFNKRTETVEDGRVMQVEKLDEEFAKVHGRKKLVIYEDE